MLLHEKALTRRAYRRDTIFALIVLALLVSGLWFIHRRSSRRQRRLVGEIERLHKRLLLYADVSGPARTQPDALGEPQQEMAAGPNEDQRFLMHVIEVVNESLPQGTYGVEAIASQLNMSVQTFRRRMKVAANESPKAFIQAIQMEKAGKLLAEYPKMPVTDVARQCGFDEVSSFTHVFKRVIGVSPTEYRDRTGP